MRVVDIKLILTILLVSCFIPQIKFVTNKSIENDQVDILLIFDNPFGPEYFHSRKVLEDRFGWNVKTTSLFKTILPCDEESYPNITVDYTIDKVPILDTFDIISIMGGPNQENLMSSTAVLNLIRSAVQKGLIVSAWCRAVRVLAAADVIDGKHITGHSDYKGEYEAAGAIYHDYVPPIVDGNIVTCVMSTQYRLEMCIALAKAVGDYEGVLPVINDVEIRENSDYNYTIEVEATDNSYVFSVYANFFTLSSSGIRISNEPFISLLLEQTVTVDIFSQCVNLSTKDYTIDIVVADKYDNTAILKDVSVLLLNTNVVNLSIQSIIFFTLMLFILITRFQKSKL